MILQPKRWESADDPRFDPIRTKWWFGKLLERKKAIAQLEEVWATLERGGCVLTQEELCDNWNVSPREFRDYQLFWTGGTRVDGSARRTYQAVLDDSYTRYLFAKAESPLHRYFQISAPFFNVPYRRVWELWEIDINFYPTTYEQQLRLRPEDRLRNKSAAY